MWVSIRKACIHNSHERRLPTVMASVNVHHDHNYMGESATWSDNT